MEGLKSKIITISGEPASGKSTVIKELENIYKEAGYKVNRISTGKLFRKAIIFEYKKLYPEIEHPLLSDIEHDPSFADKLEEIDKKFDMDFMPNLVKEFEEKADSKEILIIDSRLAWHFIPNTFAIRLTVNPKIAGERVFNDKTRGKEDKFNSIEEAINLTAQRKKDEIERYQKTYGINLTDENNYKLVINTTFASVEDIVKVINMCLEFYLKGRDFCKTWASPKLFYPSPDQRISDTYNPQFMSGDLSILNITKSIKENGIYPDAPITSITRGNSMYQFISDGHHRVFGSIMAGNTLIPYEVIKHIDSETVPRYYLSNIYDHEDICKLPDGKTFRYPEYPSIDELER